MQFRLHALRRFVAQLVSAFRFKVRFPEIAAVLPPSQNCCGFFAKKLVLLTASVIYFKLEL